jgi:hypothetical protein
MKADAHRNAGDAAPWRSRSRLRRPRVWGWLALLLAAAAWPSAGGCEADRIARERALLDDVDRAIGALVPAGACAQYDAVISAADRAVAGLADEVRTRPIVAFVGLVRNLRSGCAVLSAKSKTSLVTTWGSLRVTVGRSNESLSGAVVGNGAPPGDTAAPPAGATVP